MQTLLTFEELEAGLADLGPSPRDNGMLEMIVCRPAVDERAVLEQAELTLEDGLVGDNWRSRGKSAHLDSQITIMNSRIIQALAQERSRWALAGDQLYVDLDISFDNLPTGQRLAVGGVILEISKVPHTGCKKFEARYGSDAIRFVNSVEGKQMRRRGLNARVIQPGMIHAGDTVTKID